MASNFPNEVLYGSQTYDGYLFQHPYTNQGIEKIATLIQETVDNTQTGGLISATAEGFRLELGINTEMAEIKWDTVNVYITDSWYKSIVDFVHKSNKRCLPKNKRYEEETIRTKRLEIIENISPILKQRNNDSFIIAAFLSAKIPKNISIFSILCGCI